MIPLANPTRPKPPSLCTSQAEKTKPLITLVCFCLLLPLTLAGSAISLAQTRALPRVELKLSTAGKTLTVHAELANTDSSRKTGLMGRKQLPAGQGMVFDFKTDAIQCMWMKNTPLALDVGFFDARGQLVNVATMQPQTETIHCSTAAIRYALEVPAGWFAAQSLGAGAILHTPFQPAPTLPWLAD